MGMQKAFNYFVWKNYPSTDSSIDEANLMKINNGLNVIDDRVIMHEQTKATKTEVATLFKEIAYDEQTGILTFTRKNGATVTIDTPMEKIALNIYYDPVTEMLTLPLIDGTQMQVDLSRLITEFEFLDSDTIAFTIKPDGQVIAIVKEGSIEEKHLRPDYLADIRIESAKAEASKQAAEISAATASKSAYNAKNSETEAKKSENAAKTSETEAKKSETAAKASEVAARASETEAGKSEAAAKASENAAKNSEDKAKESEGKAKGSEISAASSASISAYNMKMSESWARGGTGLREGEDTDCGMFYAKMAEQAAARGGWISFEINDKGLLVMRKRSISDVKFVMKNGVLGVILG